MKVYARASAFTAIATLAVGAGLCWGQLQPQQTTQYPQPRQNQQQATPSMAPNGQSPALSDAQVQENVQNQLDADPSLKAAGVSATVTNGKAMLMGMVPDRTLKKRAAALARSVAGVNGVENMISISPAAAAAEPAASAATPNSGQNPAGMNAAQQEAHPPGDTLPSQNAAGTGTPVIPAQPANPSANPARVSEPPATMTAEMQQDISDALRGDPVLRPYHVTGVLTKPGSVTLEGTVPTKADRKHAALVVKGVPGVRHVDNKIHVNPNASAVTPQDPPPAQNFADNFTAQNGPSGGSSKPDIKTSSPQDVRTELQARLQGNPDLSGVVVYLSGHTVTLRGNVANRANRKQAVHLVQSSLPKNYTVRDHISINKGMGNGYPPLL